MDEGISTDTNQRKPRTWLWVAIGVVAIAVVAAFLLLRTSTVAVPQTVGLSQKDAEKAITAAGLKVGRVSEDETLTAPPGRVIEQEPAAKGQAPEGSEVNLTVAALPKVTVPKVTGETQSDAEALLAAQGLPTGGIDYANSTSVEAGRVMSQDPAADSEATVGTSVKLTVSTGPQKGQVPNVVGLPSSDAEAVIKEAGFTVKTIKAESKTVPAGDVMAQSPQAGVTSPTGSTVTLTISTGTPKESEKTEPPTTPTEPEKPTSPPETATKVPDVIGERVLDAITALQDAQLKFEIAFGPSKDHILTVDKQDPAAGSEAERGSVVTITIGLPEFLLGESAPQPTPLPSPSPSPSEPATSRPESPASGSADTTQK